MNHRNKSKKIREFILKKVKDHPKEIARLTGERFGISRQAVHRHLQRLLNDGLLETTGESRAQKYLLKNLKKSLFQVPLSSDLEEDRVWRDSVKPILNGTPPNLLEICQYGFTEILNNAIDHSEGNFATISVQLTAVSVEIEVIDDGIGIFRKIQREFSLEDQRHAILELAKGKITTDPIGHTGEGIFFTSRIFDKFGILSGELFFCHVKNEDWLTEAQGEIPLGTMVRMQIHFNSKRTLKGVLDEFAGKEGFDFSKTHVPVALVRYGDENLVSRSQAKRLLARFDKFREVLLDFKGVNYIGPAFADEIFRVFLLKNPRTKLVFIGANKAVEKMIQRALARSETGPNG